MNEDIPLESQLQEQYTQSKHLSLQSERLQAQLDVSTTRNQQMATLLIEAEQGRMDLHAQLVEYAQRRLLFAKTVQRLSETISAECTPERITDARRLARELCQLAVREQEGIPIVPEETDGVYEQSMLAAFLNQDPPCDKEPEAGFER